MNELLTQFPEGYTWPKQWGWSDYTKLEVWENELRILDWRVAVWYEYFNKENKPVRQKEEFKTLPEDIKVNEKTWKPQYPKEVWAMKVYNYKTKKVELWAATQAIIKNTLYQYAYNEKLWWLWNLDLTINKSWSWLETTYTITPVQAPLTDEVKKANEETEIDLDWYFDQWNKQEDKSWFPDEAFASAVIPE